MVPPDNSIATLNSDRAMIAGADFDEWSYRTGFDFIIPFLGFDDSAEFVAAAKSGKR